MSAKFGYLKVRVKWNQIKYLSIGGLYRSEQDVRNKLAKLRQRNPKKWEDVMLSPYGMYILDGNGKRIAKYMYQADAYVGRSIFEPILTLPIISRLYFTNG